MYTYILCYVDNDQVTGASVLYLEQKDIKEAIKQFEAPYSPDYLVVDDYVELTEEEQAGVYSLGFGGITDEQKRKDIIALCSKMNEEYYLKDKPYDGRDSYSIIEVDGDDATTY